MSLMLIKRGIEVLAGAVLMIALLTVLPAVAQAQEEGATSSPVVVVKPGDTLWSISEERLGPEATPQQIAGDVERIYALNQDQIGPDPNLIVSGQELSLPAASGSSASEPTAKNTAPAAQAAKGAAKGLRTAKGEPGNQQVKLPDLPEAPASALAMPTIGFLAKDAAPATASPVASFLHSVRSAVSSAVAASVGTLAEVRTTADRRQLLGWGIIALTLLVCALMAWKLPLRRITRYENELWGIYQGYPAVGYQAYAEKTRDPYGDTQASLPTTSVSMVAEPEPATNGSKARSNAQAASTKKGASPVGLGGIAQKRRSQLTSRTSSKRLLSHNKKRTTRSSSSAAEAHSTEVRRLLRGAVLRTRAAREHTKHTRSSGRTKTARRFAGRGGE